MSAIWGIVALEKTEQIPENAAELFETEYKKYKIDAYKTESFPQAVFGCGLQCVTPQSPGESLPRAGWEQKLLFTADCVLDNREEVIDVLLESGYKRERLEAESDGTLMYLAYCQMGKDCVKHFRGLFAFAVWDAEKRELVLVSDQVAGRCLYYIRRGNLVAFSTLMSPLVKLFPEVKPNEKYYKDFLLADSSVIYVVPGETPYQEISLMLPATVARFNAAGKTQQVYWSFENGDVKKVCKSPEEYRNQFFSLYESCVRDALVSSGEVGIAMSSGLDSSSVGVLAARELNKKGKELHSYTFVPHAKIEQTEEGNSLYDESGYVKKLAELYPNIRTTFLTNQGKNLFADMDFCMELLEMPYKTGTFPNHYEMCMEGAKAGCKVFLNGGFGNNTVSYGEINHILYDLYKRKRFVTLLNWLNRFCKHENIGRKTAIRSLFKNYREAQKTGHRELQAPDNFYLIPSILKDYDREKRFSADKRLLLATEYLDSNRYKSHLQATALLMYLGVFETKFGLATGMLLRDPTKDIRLLSFCNALPYELFAYGGTPRWLIRSSFASLLPEEMLGKWRQKGVLNVDWLDRIHRDWDTLKPGFLERLSGPDMEEWVNKKQIRKDLEEFGKAKKKDVYTISHFCAIDAVLRFWRMQK